jgi:membrane protease YdiL (CAAX protease family)
MAIESVVFALGLWGISRGLVPLLDRLGIRLDTAPPPTRLVGQIVTYVGAGIYEEVVFRLVLFALLDFIGRWTGLPAKLAFVLAALASAGLFSAAHHVGPFGEAFDSYIFLFRMLAGVYFAVLFRLRGFGIAVGTHALYDILVGVTISS